MYKYDLFNRLIINLLNLKIKTNIFTKMENIFMALTNFTVVKPLNSSYKKKDYITFIIILYLGLASFISHLIMNDKHGMPGLS